MGSALQLPAVAGNAVEIFEPVLAVLGIQHAVYLFGAIKMNTCCEALLFFPVRLCSIQRDNLRLLLEKWT